MSMRNVYKNAMVDYIKSTSVQVPTFKCGYWYGNLHQVVTGAELVQVYKSVAQNNGLKISMDHVPLNVHKFAKKYGLQLKKVKNENNRLTTVYCFNF